MDTVKFNLGDTVYLKLNPSEPCMVTGILFRPGHIIYKLTWKNASETNHYDMELTTEKTYSLND